MTEPAFQVLLDYVLRESLISPESRVLCIRAVSSPELSSLPGKLECFQTFKPEYDRLEAHNFKVLSKIPSAQFDVSLFLGGKQKQENLWTFACAIDALNEGGVFLCSMPNDLGAARFEKELRSLGLDILSYVKNRCRVFGVKKSEQLNLEVIERWRALGKPTLVTGTALLSCPGGFAWAKVDKGSKVLTECLPDELPGKGADVGAGYGYLSWHVLKHCARITEIHVIEAEKLALDMAELNLKDFDVPRRSFDWLDVAAGIPYNGLDWIVMNPPFHVGRTVRMSLGSRFVIEAAKALRRHGVLYMVANKDLPYEPILGKHFDSVERVRDAQGFKVLRAYK